MSVVTEMIELVCRDWNIDAPDFIFVHPVTGVVYDEQGEFNPRVVEEVNNRLDVACEVVFFDELRN